MLSTVRNVERLSMAKMSTRFLHLVGESIQADDQWSVWKKSRQSCAFQRNKKWISVSSAPLNDTVGTHIDFLMSSSMVSVVNIALVLTFVEPTICR